MTEARSVRAYDYINQPYETVRDAIRKDAGLQIVHRSTTTAAARGQKLVAALHVELAGVEISKDVAIDVGAIREEQPEGAFSRATCVPIAWRATEGAGLFPVMKAELRVYPLSPTETQLELAGHYEPPLGGIGAALDRALGHRVAEASIHQFVTDLASRLRAELGR
jgi:hypothetical protein